MPSTPLPTVHHRPTQVACAAAASAAPEGPSAGSEREASASALAPLPFTTPSVLDVPDALAASRPQRTARLRAVWRPHAHLPCCHPAAAKHPLPRPVELVRRRREGGRNVTGPGDLLHRCFPPSTASSVARPSATGCASRPSCAEYAAPSPARGPRPPRARPWLFPPAPTGKGGGVGEGSPLASQPRARPPPPPCAPHAARRLPLRHHPGAGVRPRGSSAAAPSASRRWWAQPPTVGAHRLPHAPAAPTPRQPRVAASLVARHAPCGVPPGASAPRPPPTARHVRGAPAPAAPPPRRPARGRSGARTA